MINVRLTREGERDVRNASIDHLEQGLAALAEPLGPTFIMLTDDTGGSMRALGSGGRYTAEYLEVFDHHLRVWRAAALDTSDDTPATVGFFTSCPQGIHSPRSCPCVVRASEILRLDDVEMILTTYHAHRSMHLGYAWRVTRGSARAPRAGRARTGNKAHHATH